VPRLAPRPSQPCLEPDAVSTVAVEGDGDVYELVAAERSLASHRRAVVLDESSAAEALQLALRGVDLLIHARAPRLVLDRLYHDLRRLGPVSVRTAASAAGPATRLGDDSRALLELIAGGLSVAAAAAELHLSLRTANRRLTEARQTLGVATTIEAIAMLSNPGAERD
jgi:DNA-binding NarL/FixJ family response regulator